MPVFRGALAQERAGASKLSSIPYLLQSSGGPQQLEAAWAFCSQQEFLADPGGALPGSVIECPIRDQCY